TQPHTVCRSSPGHETPTSRRTQTKFTDINPPYRTLDTAAPAAPPVSHLLPWTALDDSPRLAPTDNKPAPTWTLRHPPLSQRVHRLASRLPRA
ncbi:uncharacterized protein LAESUDRAFT_731199, partial [Laetiporus sulphureus 93-53]